MDMETMLPFLKLLFLRKVGCYCYKVGLAVKAAPDVSSEYPNRKRKGNCNWVVLVELSLSEYGTFFWHWPCILYY